MAPYASLSAMYSPMVRPATFNWLLTDAVTAAGTFS